MHAPSYMLIFCLVLLLMIPDVPSLVTTSLQSLSTLGLCFVLLLNFPFCVLNFNFLCVYLFCMCIGILLACRNVYHMYSWCPRRPKEGFQYSRTGVMDHCEFSCEFMEQKLPYARIASALTL